MWTNGTRRHFLQTTGLGMGWLAALDLFGAQELPNPFTPKKPALPASAKSVIWLFMEGGPSHVDTFDPKPELAKMNGQPMPASFGKVVTAMGTSNNALMASQRSFKQYGQSGIWVSDWY